MGNWLIFQHRFANAMGDGEGWPAGCWTSRFKRVGVPLGKSGGLARRDNEDWLELKWRIPRFQEKPLSFSWIRPYRKPTQVGRMKILRRLRELRRRNSAN